MVQKYTYNRIAVKPTTAAHLHKMKHYGESYDELINRIIRENKKLLKNEPTNP